MLQIRRVATIKCEVEKERPRCGEVFAFLADVEYGYDRALGQLDQAGGWPSVLSLALWRGLNWARTFHGTLERLARDVEVSNAAHRQADAEFWEALSDLRARRGR